MIKNNVYYEFFASITVPNPEEVGYWIDLGADSLGNIVKFYDPAIKRWIKLTDASSEYATAPYIGNNGHWYVDNRDTGVPAAGKNPYIGDDDFWYVFIPEKNKYVNTNILAKGLSAYDLAVKNGFVGTEEEWLYSLKKASEEAAVVALAAADRANAGADKVNAAVEDAEAALDAATDALALSEEYNNNPMKIVDNFWWKYNFDTKVYENTGIRANGKSFKIVATYESIAELMADYDNPAIEIGDFVWINTNNVEDPDDSKLFLKGETEWILVGDLSGNQGIEGQSAYEIAVTNGFIGTEQEWIDSLKGEIGNQGIPGEPGKGFKINGYFNDFTTLEETITDPEYGDIYGVGPTYDSSDTEQTNPIYQLYVKDSTGWVNNGRFTSISAGIVQELGDSETAVMSQKAVTDNLELKIDKTSFSQLEQEMNYSYINIDAFFPLPEGEYYALNTAISKITASLRKTNVTVSFKTSESESATYKFIGDAESEWYVPSKWILQVGSKKYVDDLISNQSEEISDVKGITNGIHSIISTDLQIDWSRDGYFTLKGNFVTNNYYKTSNTISVDKRQVYSLYTYCPDSILAIINVDSNGNYISTIEVGKTRDGALYIFKPDSEYIAITCYVNKMDNVSLRLANNALYKSAEFENMQIKTDLLVGYIRPNGIPSSSSSFRYTPFIFVNKDVKLYLTINASSGVYNVVSFYKDADYNSYISGIAVPVSYNKELLEIPNDAKYMVLSYPAGLANRVVLEGTISEIDKLLLYNNLKYPVEPKKASSIVLPSEIAVIKGEDNNIFIDNLISIPYTKNIISTQRVPIGYPDVKANIINGNILRYNRDNDFTLTIDILNNEASEIKESKDVVLKVVDRSKQISKNVGICICGDSKVQAGVPVQRIDELLTEDNNVNFTWIGTRTNGITKEGVAHEGRGGWSWIDYVNPNYQGLYENVFMYNGELNFQHYMQTYFPDKTLDIFVVALGTNDVSHGFGFTPSANIEESINAAKTFIDTLVSENKGFPNCKVLIGLCDVGGVQSPHSGVNPEIFRNNIQRLNNRLIETFDNGVYNPNVTTVYHGAFIDRKEGYPYEEITISELYPGKKIQYSDMIHCNPNGYKQLGNGYYNKIRDLINNL